MHTNNSDRTREGQREKGAKPKEKTPPREQTTKKLEEKHKREKEAAPDNKEEVPETDEGTEDWEARKRGINDGENKISKKQDAKKEEKVSKQEKESREMGGPVYEGSQITQKPPFKKDLEQSKKQGKQLEQEKETW